MVNFSENMVLFNKRYSDSHAHVFYMSHALVQDLANAKPIAHSIVLPAGGNPDAKLSL